MKLSGKTILATHVILFITLISIISAIVWANYAVIDEVTTGEGKVIPSRQIQVIQNLEGGIVEQIMVKEGQIVQKGQVLMKIDNTRFLASFQEAQSKLATLRLLVLRLRSEMKNQPMVIPEDLKEGYPQQAEEQQNLLQSRLEEINTLTFALKLIEKELELTRPLVKKGAASPVEVLRLERTQAELKGKIIHFKSQALEQLNKARGELAALKATIAADMDRLRRTEVRSPVKGIVKQIKVSTVGGVIQPGMDILEIVPLDDTLLIEAKIKPADIGFIAPNQEVIVKITAYDYAIYGGLKGNVEQISADAITEEDKGGGKDETYYLIRVRTDKNYLGTEKKPLYIIPGMIASVDILTGHKSVLDYILKPIFSAQEKALRER